MNESGDEQKKGIQTASAKPPLPFNVEEEKLADIEDQKDRFLVTWSEMHELGEACKFADVTRAQVERWKAADPRFNERYDDIHAAAVDRAEKRLFDLATNPDVAAGAQVKALEIYLKGNRPEKYSPKQEGGHGPIVINFNMGAVGPVSPAESPDDPSRMIDVKAEHVADA